MLFYERDSVLSDQRNDGQGDQWNDRNSAQRTDVVFRHPELDSVAGISHYRQN